MRQRSEQEVLASLCALCATGEHCTKEMTDKMARQGLSAEAQARIMAYLTGHGYVDDERYTRAFVNDKIAYNHWGRRKIEQALWQKGIARELQREVLNEVDDERYLEVLRPLLESKRRSLRHMDGRAMTQRLMAFAAGRGFDYGLIRQCLDETPCTDDDEDF